MFNSTVLEVGIGLVLIYFLLAVVCSAINESLAAMTGRRARQLEEGLRNLLRDEGHLARLLEHPLVRGLRRGSALPSYIPGPVFATAFMDLVAAGKTVAERTSNLAATLEDLGPRSELRATIEAHVAMAAGDLALLRQNVERWFDDAMDRVSGWYKRRTQLVILLIGAGLVVSLNIDSIAIGRAMAHNAVLRAALVAAADDVARRPPEEATAAAPRTATALQAELAALSVPVGWPTGTGAAATLSAIVVKLAGLLITTFAVALGAPFWFDLLSKLVNLRGAGPRARESTTTVTPSAPLSPPSAPG
jgi:hypothetical protein